MARISSEEKRREASDWFKGILGFVIIFSILIVGYFIYQNAQQHISHQNYILHRTSPS